MRYDVFVTVWGQSFVRKFIDLSLVSQLALGNLPALTKNADVYYHIYTDKESRKFFKSNLLELSRYAKIQFYYFFHDRSVLYIDKSRIVPNHGGGSVRDRAGQPGPASY